MGLPWHSVSEVVSKPGLLRRASAPAAPDGLQGTRVLMELTNTGAHGLDLSGRGDGSALETNHRGGVSALPGNHGNHK